MTWLPWLFAVAGPFAGWWVRGGTRSWRRASAVIAQTEREAEDQALAITKPPPRHGGISYSVRVWDCGRTRVWDGAGRVIYRHDCTCGLWDAALQRLNSERPSQ